MNRLLLNFCVIQCFLFIFTACKKEEEEPSPTTSTTTQQVDEKHEYLPLEIGQQWTYTNKLSDTLVTEIIQSKTFKDEVYQEVKTTTLSNNSSSTQYIRNNDNLYDQFWVTDTTTNDGFFLTVLVNQPQENQRWEYALFYEYTQYTSIASVRNSNTSHTVNNMNFDNVMIVETSVFLSPSYDKIPNDFESNYTGSVLQQIQNKDSNIFLYTYTSYYAKNIGLIEQTSTVDSYNVELIDYNFK